MGIKKALSFAHLLGRAGIRADGDQDGNEQNQDEERKQGEDESDEDYAKRMEELDKDDEGDNKKGAKAEDEEDPEADDDGETNKEKAARGRERARCAAIFGSKAAAARPDVAAHLAFNTSMSATAAISMLGAFAGGGTPAGQTASRTSLASRMQGVPDQNVGTDGGATRSTGAKGAADAILAAGKKRRGEKV